MGRRKYFNELDGKEQRFRIAVRISEIYCSGIGSESFLQGFRVLFWDNAPLYGLLDLLRL